MDLAGTEYVTFSDAGRTLRVSPRKVSRLVAAGVLTGHRSPLDARLRLVKRSELDRLVPRPDDAPRKESATAA